MDKIRKLLFVAGVLTILEILTFKYTIMLTDSLWPFKEIGVGWGIYEFYTLMLFFFLMFFTNLLLSLLEVSKKTIVIVFGLLLLYVYLIHTPYSTRPYRVLLRIIIALSCTSISTLIVYQWNKKTALSQIEK
ncbi:hypothetical protein [Seonamhaeicola sp. ML3]|uniref:hypothetical protein n=1 Tax=Seonamhaeicola sp. ML3 TaxID=2937786 RepID=UPI0020108C3D|nr:hypothetical protein [Seonamhaeicola sp. ML3]